MTASNSSLPRVLIADKFEQVGLDGLASLASVVYLPEVGGQGPQALAGAIIEHDPSILVVRSSKTPALAITAAAGKSLKAIIRAGAGVDNIDLRAASDIGVAVCNCPGMNAAAVAELIFAFLLALDRRVVEGTNDLRAGKWNKKEYSKARGLKGQTLGLIGVGNIGREVIRRARAFGMPCIAHSLNMTRDRAIDLGVEFGGSTRADLITMLPRCDAVSIMVAANAESERLCDSAFFAAMKPGACLINTSRGSVIDEAALVAAVSEKGLRVGADVFATEPAGSVAVTDWNPPSPLTSLPPGRFVGTHHIGASTDQAQLAVAEEVVRIVRVWRESGGTRIENRVNG
ncbi:MAG: NAD(P)-dependent oxidoreductase [Phycisphaerales bacterium]